MRRISRCLVLLCVLCLAGAATAQARPDDPKPRNGLSGLHSSQVSVTGGFWGPRLKIANRHTVDYALDRLEQSGHLKNFDIAAGVLDEPLNGHHAYDSDLHKALEGAMYALQNRPDPALLQRVTDMVDRIVAAQGEDGFLITYYHGKDKSERWKDMRTDHQLYNAGHFFEMAVEHHRLTGDDKALRAAMRFADYIGSIFGEGKRYDVGGHQEIELALIKLYRATGEREYLELSRFFCDERGRAHGDTRAPFVPSELEKLRGPDYTKLIPNWDQIPGQDRRRARREFLVPLRNGRMQDHKPLVEQTEAVGHAVRAGYIYAAMADIARYMDAPEYEQAAKTLWQDVVHRKMYLTGGLGTAQYHDEGFGDPYKLPNRTYCESCAGIAHVLWQHRMTLLTGEAKYADVMELALYNGAISGIGLDGDSFFYTNTLESGGGRRAAWIGLACCPTNLTRFIPQVSGFAYATGTDPQGERLYVNHYMHSDTSVSLADGTKVRLIQETEYPWEPKVRFTLKMPTQSDFILSLRVPGWAQGQPTPGTLYRFGGNGAQPITCSINGRSIDVAPSASGYLHLDRRWNSGDTVELNLPMTPRRVYAHPSVKSASGKVALMRGPVVYCLEAVDHGGSDVRELALPERAALKAVHDPDLLGGVTVLTSTGATKGGEATPITAIPYYAWANRDRGPMTVWINEAAE